MAPQEWALGEQRKRLDEAFPAYLEHGATGSYASYWPTLFIPWFETWPAEAIPLPNLDLVVFVPAVAGIGLTPKQIVALKAKQKRDADWEAELVKLRVMDVAQREVWCLGRGVDKKKQQLRTWMRWRQGNLTHASGQRQGTNIIPDLLGLSIKAKTRALTSVEKYSQLYYPTRVVSTVREDLAGLGVAPSHSQVLTTIKRVTKEIWEEEDEETKNIVLQALVDDKEKKDAKVVEGAVRTPETYQNAINELPAITRRFFEQLAAASGWSFSLLMGGPSPEEGGKIISAAHHTGMLHEGNDFGTAFRGFEDEIIAPYQAFLRKAYPAETRRQRALEVSSVNAAASGSTTVIPASDVTPAPEVAHVSDIVPALALVPALPTGLIAFDHNRHGFIGSADNQEFTLDMDAINGLDVGDGALEDEDLMKELLSYHAPLKSNTASDVDDGMFQAASRGTHTPRQDLSHAASLGTHTPRQDLSHAASLGTHTPRRDLSATGSSPSRVTHTHASPNPFVVVASANLTDTLPVPTRPPRFPTRPPPKGVKIASQNSTVSTQSTAARERFATLQNGKNLILAAKAKKAITTASPTPSPSFSRHLPRTIPLPYAHQPLHSRLLDEAAMNEAELALAAQHVDSLLRLPEVTSGELQARRCEDQLLAAERRETAKLGAAKEDRAQKDISLKQLVASRAAETSELVNSAITVQQQVSADQQVPSPTDEDAIKTAAARKTEQKLATIASAAERKLRAEEAVMKALQMKAETEKAVKLAAQAKAIEVEAADVAARMKATEDAAAEVTVQLEDVPEREKKKTRKELAEAKRLAKTTAAAEEKKRKEEEQIAKEAAYNQAMLNNNAGHLITNPFSLSDNAPPWLTELVVYLPEQDLGSEWRGCIQAFVTLHVDMGCADMVEILGCANRPAPIGKWLKCARQLDKPPSLDATTYPKQWAKWWSGLQPSWRQGDGMLPPSQYICDQGEWGPLRNCGRNGLGMVLLSLIWWGRALGESPLWTAAVMDVARVMEAMVQADGGNQNGKRAGQVDKSSRAKRTRTHK